MTRLPTSNELMAPIVDALRSLGGSGTVGDITGKVAEQMGIPGGVPTELQHRVSAALSRLERRGKTKQGMWSLTSDSDASPSPSSQVSFPMPDCVPFRRTSGYAKIFAILFAFREKGISLDGLRAAYVRWSQKDRKRADYDLRVVLSAREDGSSHKSIGTAAKRYWVVNRNGLIILQLPKPKESVE